MRCEVELKHLVKEFHSQGRQVLAVDDVSLTFSPGSFVTLLGPSGCGKTTILRMVAGLENPTSGDILLDGKSIIAVPPNARQTAMVFQSYALFPHLSVFENVAYGLRLRRVPSDEVKRLVNEKLAMMGLEGMGDRQPNQLSGGQQQRVALARALVMSPKVLLFDEPLSNLDAKLRIQVREEIRRLQRELEVTSIYVTHDQEEAMAISDLVVVMNKGKVEQAGAPEEIYHTPESVFVADFIGGVNLIDGTLTGADSVKVLGRDVPVRNPRQIPTGSAVKVAVRPERVQVGEGPWQAVVERSIFLGKVTEYQLRVGDLTLKASVPGNLQRLAEGEIVACGFEPDAALALRP